jgi:hypothetical protein
MVFIQNTLSDNFWLKSIFTLLRTPAYLIRIIRLRIDEKIARRYLFQEGVLEVIPKEEKEEFPPNIL